MVVTDHVFWDITPYIPLKVNRRFGVTYSSEMPVRTTLQMDKWITGNGLPAKALFYESSWKRNEAPVWD
jgi:hypothetical protein